MHPRRRALLAVVLVMLPALAGCNVRDWWDMQGTIKVELGPLGPSGSAIHDFRTLKVAIYGVSLRQAGELNPKEFSFGAEPLLVDMVEKGRRGETVPLMELKASLRPMTAVTIRVEVVDAIDATGKRLPACHPGKPVESRPCVSTPENGAYRLEELTFSPARGGEITYVFPLAVQFNDELKRTRGLDEYYLQSDPALIRVDAKR